MLGLSICWTRSPTWWTALRKSGWRRLTILNTRSWLPKSEGEITSHQQTEPHYQVRYSEHRTAERIKHHSRAPTYAPGNV